MLLEAKGQLKHGQWLPWIRRHTRIERSTAEGYIRVAEEYPSDSQLPGNLTYTAALKAITGAKRKLASATGTKVDREPAPGSEEEKARFAWIIKHIETGIRDPKEAIFADKVDDIEQLLDHLRKTCPSDQMRRMLRGMLASEANALILKGGDA